MGGGKFNLWIKSYSKEKLVKTKLKSRDAQVSDKAVKKHKNMVLIKASTVVISRGWEGTMTRQVEGFLEWLEKFNFFTWMVVSRILASFIIIH